MVRVSVVLVVVGSGGGVGAGVVVAIYLIRSTVDAAVSCLSSRLVLEPYRSWQDGAKWSRWCWCLCLCWCWCCRRRRRGPWLLARLEGGV